MDWKERREREEFAELWRITPWCYIALVLPFVYAFGTRGLSFDAFMGGVGVSFIGILFGSGVKGSAERWWLVYSLSTLGFVVYDAVVRAL